MFQFLGVLRSWAASICRYSLHDYSTRPIDDARVAGFLVNLLHTIDEPFKYRPNKYGNYL